MSLTPEQVAGLAAARHLAENGAPIFRAPRDESSPVGFRLPRDWQNTAPDVSVVDRWKPGDALCLVTGVLVDVVDIDPRNGGDRAALNGTMPTSYGRQTTPSGGTHDLIAPLGVPKGKPFDGIDVQAGDANGEGRGFVFLAPTERPSKVTGVMGTYTWIAYPDVDMLVLVGGDDSGAALVQAMRSERKTDYSGPTYDGPSYVDLPPQLQEWSDRHMAEVVGTWRARFAAALDWPDGQTDDDGRGWEALSRDWAWACARMAVTPWLALEEDGARDLYDDVLPIDLATNDRCSDKWSSALLGRAAAKTIEAPPWEGFDVPMESDNPEDWPDIPSRLEDAHLAAWMAYKGLDRCWCWAGGLGWMHWDGRRWVARREEDAKEAVRLEVIEINKRALEAGATGNRLKLLHGLLVAGKIGTIANLMRGVVAVDGGAFDQQPDLLNVGNGVVDLRTGELLPHDRKYHLTKITETPYIPDATHPDWTQALAALDDPVADWMQVRFGQAATGYPTSDDVLTIGQGGGSNGKSTILSALFGALGGHMSQVPEKLLRASPNDHPTELMTLYGARLAVIDETPEVAQLNVQRLKAVLGQDWITARAIRRDNVTWKATHSLFVMTNYVPSVRETDHGTWRRLALVRFTKTFPKDDRFRARMARGQGGRREAVLAWVVEGARRWYDNEQMLPPMPDRVALDTQEWRRESDAVLAYVSERLVFDADACVTTGDLLEDFNDWLYLHGNQPWSDKLLSSRFGGHEEVARHGVAKANPRNPAGLVRRYTGKNSPARPNVWLGVRWRTEKDPN